MSRPTTTTSSSSSSFLRFTNYLWEDQAILFYRTTTPYYLMYFLGRRTQSEKIGSLILIGKPYLLIVVRMYRGWRRRPVGSPPTPSLGATSARET